MLAEKGVRAIAVIWTMTAMSFILIPLRIYTRVYVLKAFGSDDYFYNLGWVFLLLYAIFVNIAGIHGFGQPMASLSLNEAAKAVYMEMIGQTFAVLGMAIAKLSLGLFLLRIVVKPWHRQSIWVAMISLALISILTAMILWVQRLPSESIYNASVPGHSIVSVTPFSILLGVWCSMVDFYFATLPWLFVMKLNMVFREKMIVAISLSLGFIAGICGIIRTVDLGGLSSANYTESTVNLIIWSGVELAVTLFCAGIPALSPLFRRRNRSGFERSGSSYIRHHDGAVASSQVSLTDLHGQDKNGSTNIMAGDKSGISINSEQPVFSDNHDNEDTVRPCIKVQPREWTDGIRVKNEVRVDRS